MRLFYPIFFAAIGYFASYIAFIDFLGRAPSNLQATLLGAAWGAYSGWIIANAD